MSSHLRRNKLRINQCINDLLQALEIVIAAAERFYFINHGADTVALAKAGNAGSCTARSFVVDLDQRLHQRNRSILH